MNALSQILTPARTVCCAPGLSKKRLFETIATIVCEDQLALLYDEVLDHLVAREKLGSTGFGRGVAIPHARIEGISRPIIALLKPHKPVDFGAADGLPVDLVIGLLSPENYGATYLHALAAISRLVRDERIHDALTEMSNPEAIYAMLSNATDRDAA